MSIFPIKSDNFQDIFSLKVIWLVKGLEFLFVFTKKTYCQFVDWPLDWVFSTEIDKKYHQNNEKPIVMRNL